MVDPVEHMRRRLIARVRQIIDDHRAAGLGPDGLLTCSCGADGLSDHPGHVAERVIDGLAIKPDIDEVSKSESVMPVRGLTGSSPSWREPSVRAPGP